MIAALQKRLRWLPSARPASLTSLIVLVLALPTSQRANAQFDDAKLDIFGFFQTEFVHRTNAGVITVESDSLLDEGDSDNSFSVQQLDLFFRTDLSPQWRAFVNFEFLNNFSSTRAWGSAHLEEVWLRYRSDQRFSVKVGLQIPIFNHFNEIKNRTPLIPYVIRPLVYETSFGEFLSIEDYVPHRAFVQAYGTLRSGSVRFDYAAYVGNSPNINTTRDNEQIGDDRQTGVDTTTTFLWGGRVGLRVGGLKAGVSATADKTNEFAKAAVEFLGGLPPHEQLDTDAFELMPRYRIGADLSASLGDLFVESEMIAVRYQTGHDRLELSRLFYYMTVGYDFSESIVGYVSYVTTEDVSALINEDDVDVGDDAFVQVPMIGAAYRVGDRLTFKAQYAFARVKVEVFELEAVEKNHFIALAASVLF